MTKMKLKKHKCSCRKDIRPQIHLIASNQLSKRKQTLQSLKKHPRRIKRKTIKLQKTKQNSTLKTISMMNLMITKE